MRSLHPADAVHKGFGTIPTSILQRKNGVCIYERPACQPETIHIKNHMVILRATPLPQTKKLQLAEQSDVQTGI